MLYIISFFSVVFKNLKYLFHFSHPLNNWFAFIGWKSAQPFPCCLGNSSQGFHQVKMSARSSFRHYPKITEDCSIRTAFVWNPPSHCESSRQGMKRRQIDIKKSKPQYCNQNRDGLTHNILQIFFFPFLLPEYLNHSMQNRLGAIEVVPPNPPHSLKRVGLQLHCIPYNVRALFSIYFFLFSR